MEKEESFGAKIKLNLLQFVLKTNVLYRSTGPHLEKLNLTIFLPTTSRHYHRQRDTQS